MDRTPSDLVFSSSPVECDHHRNGVCMLKTILVRPPFPLDLPLYGFSESVNSAGPDHQANSSRPSTSYGPTICEWPLPGTVRVFTSQSSPTSRERISTLSRGQQPPTGWRDQSGNSSSSISPLSRGQQPPTGWRDQSGNSSSSISPLSRGQQPPTGWREQSGESSSSISPLSRGQQPPTGLREQSGESSSSISPLSRGQQPPTGLREQSGESSSSISPLSRGQQPPTGWREQSGESSSSISPLSRGQQPPTGWREQSGESSSSISPLSRGQQPPTGLRDQSGNSSSSRLINLMSEVTNQITTKDSAHGQQQQQQQRHQQQQQQQQQQLTHVLCFTHRPDGGKDVNNNPRESHLRDIPYSSAGNAHKDVHDQCCQESIPEPGCSHCKPTMPVKPTLQTIQYAQLPVQHFLNVNTKGNNRRLVIPTRADLNQQILTSASETQRKQKTNSVPICIGVHINNNVTQTDHGKEYKGIKQPIVGSINKTTQNAAPSKTKENRPSTSEKIALLAQGPSARSTTSRMQPPVKSMVENVFKTKLPLASLDKKEDKTNRRPTSTHEERFELSVETATIQTEPRTLDFEVVRTKLNRLPTYVEETGIGPETSPEEPSKLPVETSTTVTEPRTQQVEAIGTKMSSLPPGTDKTEQEQTDSSPTTSPELASEPPSETATLQTEPSSADFEVIQKKMSRLPTYTVFSCLSTPAYSIKSYRLLSDIEEVFFPECQVNECHVLQTVFAYLGFDQHMATYMPSMGKIHCTHYQKVPLGEHLIRTPVLTTRAEWYQSAAEVHTSLTRRRRLACVNNITQPVSGNSQNESTGTSTDETNNNPLLGEIHHGKHVFPMIYTDSGVDIFIAASDLAQVFPHEVARVVEGYQAQRSTHVRTASREEAVALMRYKAAFGNLTSEGHWHYLTSNSLLISWRYFRPLTRPETRLDSDVTTVNVKPNTPPMTSEDTGQATRSPATAAALLSTALKKMTKSSRQSPKYKSSWGKKRKRSSGRSEQNKRKCSSPRERHRRKGHKAMQNNKVAVKSTSPTSHIHKGRHNKKGDTPKNISPSVKAPSPSSSHTGNVASSKRPSGPVGTSSQVKAASPVRIQGPARTPSGSVVNSPSPVQIQGPARTSSGSVVNGPSPVRVPGPARIPSGSVVNGPSPVGAPGPTGTSSGSVVNGPSPVRVPGPARTPSGSVANGPSPVQIQGPARTPSGSVVNGPSPVRVPGPARTPSGSVVNGPSPVRIQGPARTSSGSVVNGPSPVGAPGPTGTSFGSTVSGRKVATNDKSHSGTKDTTKGMGQVKKGLWLLQQKILEEEAKTKSKKHATKQSIIPKQQSHQGIPKDPKYSASLTQDFQSVVTSNPFTQSIETLKSASTIGKIQRPAGQSGSCRRVKDTSPHKQTEVKLKSSILNRPREKNSPQRIYTKDTTNAFRSSNLLPDGAQPEPSGLSSVRSVRFSMDGEVLIPGEEKNKDRQDDNRAASALSEFTNVVLGKGADVAETVSPPAVDGSIILSRSGPTNSEDNPHYVVENPGFYESPVFPYDPLLELDDVGAFYDVTAENDNTIISDKGLSKGSALAVEDIEQIASQMESKSMTIQHNALKKNTRKKKKKKGHSKTEKHFSSSSSSGEDIRPWNGNVSTGRKLILRATKSLSSDDLSAVQQEQGRIWEIIQSGRSPGKVKTRKVGGNTERMAATHGSGRNTENITQTQGRSVDDQGRPSDVGDRHSQPRAASQLSSGYKLYPSVSAGPGEISNSGMLVVDDKDHTEGGTDRLAYVLNNGYPYVSLSSVREALLPPCVKRCGIGRAVLKITPGLGNRMCSFEEAALLTEEERQISRKPSPVCSGTTLVRADLLLAKLDDIRKAVRQAHYRKLPLGEPPVSCLMLHDPASFGWDHDGLH